MSPLHVEVRRAAAPQDIGPLVTLMQAFYAEAGLPLDRSWAASAFERLLSRPALGCVLLALAGGEAAGHAVLTLRYTMEHGGLCGHVDDLFVRPAFRRQGVGSALLSALFEECRARDGLAVLVDVGLDNGPARRLYARFGLAPQEPARLTLCGPAR